MVKKVSRIEFEKLTLGDNDVEKNPFDQLRLWWDEAVTFGIHLIDAVHLSTVDQHNHPDARIVLLKSFDEEGLVFYTNYQSEKATQLAHNPQACMVIFWPKVERQIRIRGIVKKTTPKESDNYFKQRPRGAQIGAWASPQSQIIANRTHLDEAFLNLEKRFENQEVPRPAHWGGFRLIPTYFEFWQGRSNRLHDRICFKNDASTWESHRLGP